MQQIGGASPIAPSCLDQPKGNMKMPTANETITSTWTDFETGPKDVNIQNLSLVAECYYAKASATPAGNGHYLKPLETHPVNLANGEKLYVRHTAKADYVEVSHPIAISDA
jgi:hypothetical protein